MDFSSRKRKHRVFENNRKHIIKCTLEKISLRDVYNIIAEYSETPILTNKERTIISKYVKDNFVDAHVLPHSVPYPFTVKDLCHGAGIFPHKTLQKYTRTVIKRFGVYGRQGPSFGFFRVVGTRGRQKIFGFKDEKRHKFVCATQYCRANGIEKSATGLNEILIRLMDNIDFPELNLGYNGRIY